MLQKYHEEHTHGTPDFPLQVYSHYDKDGFFFVSQHWHEELEWIYVENGALNLTVHSKVITLHAGEFCFINSGEMHEIKSLGESRHLAIVFNPNILDFTLYDACQHNFIRPVTGGKLVFPTLCSALPPKDYEKIIFHMQEIRNLYDSLPSSASLSIKIHILQVLELLFRTSCFLENTHSSEKEDVLKKIIEYIHTNYANPIALQTLADLCFMSPNYFCHYFKQKTGKPPIAFINEYRIQKACQMLSDSELPVSQIALSVGFDNFSYFIRKFREYKGVTPKKYRSLCISVSD